MNGPPKIPPPPPPPQKSQQDPSPTPQLQQPSPPAADQPQAPPQPTVPPAAPAGMEYTTPSKQDHIDGGTGAAPSFVEQPPTPPQPTQPPAGPTVPTASEATAIGNPNVSAPAVADQPPTPPPPPQESQQDPSPTPQLQQPSPPAADQPPAPPQPTVPPAAPAGMEYTTPNKQDHIDGGTGAAPSFVEQPPTPQKTQPSAPTTPDVQQSTPPQAEEESVEEMEDRYFGFTNPSARQNLVKAIESLGGKSYDPAKMSYEDLYSEYQRCKSAAMGQDLAEPYRGPSAGPSNEPWDRRRGYIVVRRADPNTGALLPTHEVVEVYGTPEEREQFRQQVDNETAQQVAAGAFLGLGGMAQARTANARVSGSEPLHAEAQHGAPLRAAPQYEAAAPAGEQAPVPAKPVTPPEAETTTAPKEPPAASPTGKAAAPAVEKGPALGKDTEKATADHVPGPPAVWSDNVKLTGDTAGTGGIKEISAHRNADGSIETTIKGDLKPSIKRDDAPNFQNDKLSGEDMGLHGYERSHQYGPGFGDEARDGMTYAPKEVNQIYQNKKIEDKLRELGKLASQQGATIKVNVKTTTYPRDTWKGQGHELLKDATYHFEVKYPDGSSAVIGEVDISVPPPSPSGYPTGRPIVSVTGGSAGVWSLK